MIIPKDPAEREQLYDEVIIQCEKSQQDRNVKYERRRSYYLTGSEDENDPTAINKVYPHLDMITSFLFASETTKFSVNPNVSEPEPEHWRSGAVGQAINERWHDSNSDMAVSSAITWALVYDSMIVKVVPNVNTKTKTLHLNPFAIHPGTFGVYREDVNTLDRQQALVQTYYTTEDELAKRLEGHPKRDEILNSLSPAQTEEQRPSAYARVLMGAWQPVGNPTPQNGSISFNLSDDMGYRPEEVDKLRVLKELWIWDDERNDYRVVTRTKDGGYSIYDTPNFFLPGEHPFIKFTPRPLPFYIWGESEVAGLIPLQNQRNWYIAWMKKTLDLQLNPPTSISGFGLVEERVFSRMISGSFLSDDGGGMPGAKVDMHRPPMPQDIYRMVGEIDAAFNEYSGLPNTVQGKGEAGVRSGKQADSLARIGSSRIRKRALVIEDSLEKMAYLYARLMQKHDPTTYRDAKGNVFVMSQFTKDYMVKVDGHSNSPVFIEDKRDLAFALLKDSLITKRRAVEMIDPPDKEAILRELPQIEQAGAAAEQAKEQSDLKKEALKHAPEGFMQKLLAKLFGIQ